MKQEEEHVWLEIKKAFDDKVIYKKDQEYILDYNKLSEEIPIILEELLAHPLKIVEYIKAEIKDRTDRYFPIKHINISEDEEISNLRIEHIGKIVKITGMLSNATGVLALVKRKTFECISCGAILFIDGSGKPKRCSCGNTNNFRCTKTEFQNLQEIVLEENQDEIGDRNPKKTRVRLLDELCDKEMNGVIKDGNKIEVVGIVEEIPLKKDNMTKEEIYQFRIFALQIKSLENEFDETITEEDIIEIEEISYDNPLNKLSKSLSPSIIGYENIKKSIVLSMVGGTPIKKRGGKKEKHLIHILLIGDAGQGKTVLLQESVRRHFKGRYITGERLSEAGVTAGIVKDELLGVFALKAGALPKTNKGFLSIDELDKTDRGVQKALHTPMESGIVTISKAGITATLNSEVSILVGANPKNSKFDISKPLIGQINMEDTLLTRFDLIHIMKDNMDENRDKKIAESIFQDDEEFETLDIELFRKYIKYAQNFKPKFTSQSQKLIIDFYPKIRKKSKSITGNIEGMPIVARHLKGIKRLAEASAKVRLSNEVNIEDVNTAIDLFKDSLFKLGVDEDGVLDMARLGPGRTSSKKKMLEIIYQLLVDLSKDGDVIESKLIELCGKTGISSLNVLDSLEQLSKEGFVYKTTKGWNKT